MKFLLQINRIKLQDYIQGALIAPDIYLGDEIEKDVQSKNPNFLVLSDGYFNELDEHQILLELILTKTEKLKLKKVVDIYYMDFPLPITRIKKIYVQNVLIKNHIMINMDTSEKGFLSDRLFDVFQDNKAIFFDQKSLIELKDDAKENDYSIKMRIFDKKLGMFSFMKNTNIYYTNDTGIISNYSDNPNPDIKIEPIKVT